MNLLDSICGTSANRLPAREDEGVSPDTFIPNSDVPHKRPQSLQDLLRSRNATPAKPVDVVAPVAASAETPELRGSSVLNAAPVVASAEKDVVTTVDQLYGAEDAADHNTFVSTPNPLNEAKEGELEGISVLVYSEEGDGSGSSGIDGLCAFNDIQLLAGTYRSDPIPPADPQKTTKSTAAAAPVGILRTSPAPRAAVPSSSSSVPSSAPSAAQVAAQAALTEEVAALRAKNELLTMQMARQTEDMAALSEQILAHGLSARHMQVEAESTERDRAHLRRVVASLESEVKRLEVELSERALANAQLREAALATDRLVGQLEEEGAMLRAVRAELEGSERDRATLRRLAAALEAEVVALKTENSQLRCTAAAGGAAAAAAAAHTVPLASTSNFVDYPRPSSSSSSSSASSSAPAASATAATAAAAAAGERLHNAAAAAAAAAFVQQRSGAPSDRRKTMSSLDFEYDRGNSHGKSHSHSHNHGNVNGVEAGGGWPQGRALHPERPVQQQPPVAVAVAAFDDRPLPTASAAPAAVSSSGSTSAASTPAPAPVPVGPSGGVKSLAELVGSAPRRRPSPLPPHPHPHPHDVHGEPEPYEPAADTENRPWLASQHNNVSAGPASTSLGSGGGIARTGSHNGHSGASAPGPAEGPGPLGHVHAQGGADKRPVDLRMWRREGYPSEYAYAQATGVLETTAAAAAAPPAQPPSSSHVPTASASASGGNGGSTGGGSSPSLPSPPRPRRHSLSGRPPAPAPFGTDESVALDISAYDGLERKLTAMMAEKQALSEESERLAQRGGKKLQERTRLTQVESRMLELGRDIAATRKELTRRPA